MTFFGGPLNNPMDDLFGRGFPPPKPKEEKGVPWTAKIIDGEYYVPLKQVAELLKANDVLPKVRAGIERRVENGPNG